MLQTNKNGSEIKELVSKGLVITMKKLIEQKSLTDGVLVFSKDGKIVKVKARDFLNK